MAGSRWAEVRHQYGDVYITAFPDGLIVPWKPLSLGDYIYYDQQIARLTIPPAYLEDEVFRKCVQDQDIVAGMDSLLAGTVTTVVHNIWEYSGPNSPQKLQSDLEAARETVQNGRAAVLHQCAYMIATGFNYTLEQVYALDYETFMLRLAQAEAKLMTMGMIQEPLSLNVNEQPQTKFTDLNKRKRVKVDAKQVWEQQQAAARARQSKKPKGKWWDVSPALESSERKPINFAIEKDAIDETNLDSHERMEQGAMRKHIIESKLAGQRAKMIDDAKIIYKDLIAELEKSKK